MANYYASARTNYFLVKDIEAFTNEVEPISVELSTKTVDDKTFVCLLSDGEGGFPWEYYEETSDDYLEVDWDAIFVKHLQDDSVAIIIESGAEKLRFIAGVAIAFNNKGETKRVDLNDIYTLAESLGSDITRAED